MLETLFHFYTSPLVEPIACALIGYIAGQYWPWSTTGKAAVESRVATLEAKVEGLFSKDTVSAVLATPAPPAPPAMAAVVTVTPVAPVAAAPATPAA